MMAIGQVPARFCELKGWKRPSTCGVPTPEGKTVPLRASVLARE
jgi:hypothetical protein